MCVVLEVLLTVSNDDISATNVTIEGLTSEWLMVWVRCRRNQLYTVWGR
jgi:hypothetical protein